MLRGKKFRMDSIAFRVVRGGSGAEAPLLAARPCLKDNAQFLLASMHLRAMTLVGGTL